MTLYVKTSSDTKMNHSVAIENSGVRPHAIVIPGVAGAVEVVQGFSSSHLLVDGKPIFKRTFARSYELPGVDGTKVKARLLAGFRGSSLTVAGTRYPIGRQMPTGLALLAFVPIIFFFVLIGGALGGGINGTAIIANRRIATTDLRLLHRVELMVVVCLVALMVNLFLVFVLHGTVSSLQGT